MEVEQVDLNSRIKSPPRTQGSGSGLENLKPEPPQAEPEPGHSGRAGPATSLTMRSNDVSFGLEKRSTPGQYPTACNSLIPIDSPLTRVYSSPRTTPTLLLAVNDFDRQPFDARTHADLSARTTRSCSRSALLDALTVPFRNLAQAPDPDFAPACNARFDAVRQWHRAPQEHRSFQSRRTLAIPTMDDPPAAVKQLCGDTRTGAALLANADDQMRANYRTLSVSVTRNGFKCSQGIHEVRLLEGALPVFNEREGFESLSVHHIALEEYFYCIRLIRGFVHHLLPFRYFFHPVHYVDYSDIAHIEVVGRTTLSEPTLTTALWLNCCVVPDFPVIRPTYP
ncbi:hypothetical protein C8R45DRAFT_926654 [Mycena sanguinolenta]|nr:hypothetical protein C8R45DRAFT_926654 [Mycena sanguinolenta]